MKFSVAISYITLFSTTVSAVPSGEPCGDYTNIYSELTDENCRANRIVEDVLRPIFESTKSSSCTTSFSRDLRIITQTSTTVEAKEKLDEMCEIALESAASTAGQGGVTIGWGAIENENVDLTEFFEGNGFLNKETGNFQQDDSDLEPDTSFYYTGTDPRKNDHYPTTEESYQAGLAVDSFLQVAEREYLEDPTGTFSTCAHQAVMCCWHRDRQYKDGNGNCSPNNCYDRDPGDNTDLCWTEDEAGNPTPYPGDEDEGDLHCHGFVWSELQDDVNSHARWNNLFYVAMHDHMYTRGYVESITNIPEISNIQPMCGCIEDMNPVSRADCTEALPATDYIFSSDANGVISVAPKAGTYRVEFEACEGYIYDSEVSPEEYEDALQLDLLEEKDNDLSAFVFRMYLEEKLSLGVMENIFEKLVGYEDPNTNNNVAACKAAYEAKFTGQVYPAA